MSATTNDPRSLQALARRPELQEEWLGACLSALVATPSVSGVDSERAMAERVAAYLEPAGCELTFVESLPGRPSLAAVLEGAGSGPRLVLNGHMDTVPPDDLSLWTVDPFGGEIRDGAVWGRGALDGVVREFHHFELPHWDGPGKVLHLMSVVSLVDEDLAVVYPRAMPIRLRELLLERGYRLVEVPDKEFGTQGANVLALAPGCAVICAGNPVTSAALRDAGAEVLEYEGEHIPVRRISGPTCNTRPLLRA